MSTFAYGPDLLGDVLVTRHVIPTAPESTGNSCPPQFLRTLRWPRTQAGDTAVISCPLGTTGRATWSCAEEGGHWDTERPDLSGCQSLWLIKILSQLRGRSGGSVVHLAKEMAHYSVFNALYGGDVTGLATAAAVVAEKLSYELEAVPSEQQREAVVMEVAQSVVKAASVALSAANAPAWKDLPAGERERAATAFVRAVKAAGMLLPEAARENQEITISSPNIRKWMYFYS